MTKIDERGYEFACKAFDEIDKANGAWENLNFPGYFYHSGKVFYLALLGIAHDIGKAII